MHPGAKRPRRPISDDSEENSSHVLRDDLRTVIDNLGQTPSDRGTTPGPSSVLEVSLKQITYRDRNPVRAQSEDPRALNRGGLVHRIDCPQHSSNSSEEANYQCCCCYNSDESDETSAGIAQIRPDTPRYQTDSEQAAATGGIPETRIIEERRTLQPCYNYESVNRYSNNGKRNDCGCTESGLPKPNSGTLLPQLYTANVKNTVGAAAPERFTFNAITGIPDYKLVENISNNVSKPHKMRVQSSPALGANQAAPYNESLYSPQSLPGKVSKENLAPRTDRHNVNYFHLKQDYSVFHPPPERIDVYCFDHQNAG
ncbi:hypothetical protein AAG570_005743 [Ranatra chinensis]|uniref:Uncharacterized protein n=1 Tax=Ranatra chinensis TaxID=642074 RepID=A0ABD0YDA9_9HEMI